MPAPVGHPNWNLENIGRPKKYTDEFINNEAIEFCRWFLTTDALYFKEFAFERGYSPQRLSEFANSNKNFSEALNIAHEWQEIKLFKGGLTGEFNSGFCKFAMSNICGWADKSEQKLSTDPNNPIAPWIQQANGTSKDLVDG